LKSLPLVKYSVEKLCCDLNVVDSNNNDIASFMCKNLPMGCGDIFYYIIEKLQDNKIPINWLNVIEIDDKTCMTILDIVKFQYATTNKELILRGLKLI
jgi:hypothetical protein